jgi:hypothetical protein
MEINTGLGIYEGMPTVLLVYVPLDSIQRIDYVYFSYIEWINQLTSSNIYI